MNDSQLLQEYAASHSDDAFKTLVDQHLGLVYSACYRQLKNRHLAEDATQAVFILLSQKAGGLRQNFLTGWLLNTSRYACANIRRSEKRHQRREQVVAMNQIPKTEASSVDLIDLLDEALCHLKTTDREALVLRYLKEHPIEEVAQTLGVTPEAARKRVYRGLEKLRKYLTRRGIATSSAALGSFLTEQLPGVALSPAARHAITQGILQACRAGIHGTAASVAIAKGTNTMMYLAKLKTAVALAAITAAVGTTGWMISRAVADNPPAPQAAAPQIAAPPAPPLAAAPPAPPAATQPGIDLSTPEKTFASIIVAFKAGNGDELHQCLLADPDRQPQLVDKTFEWNLAIDRMLGAARQAYGPQGASQLFQGRTIEDIMQIMAAVGPWKRSINGDSAVLSVEIPPTVLAMFPPAAKQVLTLWSGAPIRFKQQAGQWKLDLDQTVRVVMRIPTILPATGDDEERKAAILQQMIDSTNQLAQDISSGQLPTFADAAQAVQQSNKEILTNNGLRGFNAMILLLNASIIPNVNYGRWTFFSSSPATFAAAMDPNTLHNGHPTFHISSFTAIRRQAAWYQCLDPATQQYIGHRVRMTAWIKSDQSIDGAGLRINVYDIDNKIIADDGQHKKRPIKGTTDWTQYTAYAQVPKGAVVIQWGFIMAGSGQIWVDLDTAKIDLAPDLEQGLNNTGAEN